MERHRPWPGQSRVAVDAVCGCRRIADLDSAKESCAGPLLALAGGLGEVPRSVFAAGQYWEPSGMVPFVWPSQWRIVRCHGNQPALCTDVDCDAGKLPSGIDNRCTEPVPLASHVPGRVMDLRIRGSPLGVVRALAKNFGRVAEGGAIAWRTRSRSAGQVTAHCRCAPHRHSSVAGFSGAGNLRHRAASIDMAGGNLQSPRRCAPGSDSRARGVARTPARQSGGCDPHARGGAVLVPPVGLVAGSAAGRGARARLR